MIPRACTCIDTLDASLCPVDGAPHVPIADIERRIAAARDLCIRRLADWLSAQRGSDVTEAQDEALAQEVFAHGAMAPDFTAAREAGAKQRTVDIIRLLVDKGFIAEAELVRMTYAPSPERHGRGCGKTLTNPVRCGDGDRLTETTRLCRECASQPAPQAQPRKGCGAKLTSREGTCGMPSERGGTWLCGDCALDFYGSAPLQEPHG